MFYCNAYDLDGEIGGLYETETEIKKGDFIVVPNHRDIPVICRVEELLSKYQALSAMYSPTEVICVVNMDDYKAKREKELENRILVDKMKEKMSEVQLLEKFEKYAGKDSHMQELLNQFKGIDTTSQNIGKEAEF